MSDDHPGVAAAGPSPRGEPPTITPREKEILRLIAEGLTDQEIAERLWVSVHTARTHQAHLREKFQVRNRTALVREAERFGCLTKTPQESLIIAIGEEPHLGYTPDQEVAPKPSPEQVEHPTRSKDDSARGPRSEQPGGEASADGEGETEMLNPRLHFWYLAALLALGAQHGTAAAEAVQPARAPRASAPGAAVENTHNAAAGMVTRRIWAGPGVNVLGAPSPDGRYLTFVDWATGDLAIRDLTTGQNRRLTNRRAESDSYQYAWDSTFSPDGRQVAYSWALWNENRGWFCDLRLVGLDGARPRVLYCNESFGWLNAADWSSDGKHILALFSERRGGGSQIALISAADGGARVLKRFPRGTPGEMRLSPDGRTIAYDYAPAADTPERDIFLLATDGSGEIPLVRHPADDFVLGWAPDGKSLLFASDRTGTTSAWLLRVTDGKPQGSPELVRREMGAASPLGLDRKSSLYYGLQAGIVDVYTASLDPATGRVPAPPQPVNPRLVGTKNRPAWSPDGRSLAYLSMEKNTRPGGSPILTIRTVESGETRDLSLRLDAIGGNTNEQLTWSPDGRSLLARGRDKEGRPGVFRIDAQTGDVTPRLDAENLRGWVAWAPDGKSIFHPAGTSADALVIQVRDLATGREKELYRGPYRMDRDYVLLAVSPDGQQLAFTEVQEGGRTTSLKVMPAAGGEPRELLRGKPSQRLQTMAWMPDGRHLLVGWKESDRTDPEKKPVEVWRIAVAGGEPQRLGLTMDGLLHLSVHPNGRRLAFTAGQPKQEVWVMENLFPAAQTAQAAARRR